MKKIYLLGIAALSLLAVSCGKDNKDNIDWDAVTVNGFYVAGPATGSDEIKADCVMAAGFNEVDKAVREGMYEKYIVLEGGKEFYLLYNDGGNKERYSATLTEFTTPEEEAYSENPESVLKGKLVTGTKAPAMKVWRRPVCITSCSISTRQVTSRTPRSCSSTPAISACAAQ